jgi:hypothetical protein
VAERCENVCVLNGVPWDNADHNYPIRQQSGSSSDDKSSSMSIDSP